MLQCRQSWGADGEVEQTPKAKIANGVVLAEPAAFNRIHRIAIRKMPIIAAAPQTPRCMYPCFVLGYAAQVVVSDAVQNFKAGSFGVMCGRFDKFSPGCAACPTVRSDRPLSVDIEFLCMICNQVRENRMINKLLGVTFLLLICLTSCTPNSRSQSESRFLLASASVCPEVDMYSKPSYSNKAVYILLDNSGSYRDYYGGAYQLLQEVLAQTLRPGDFLGIGLIGRETAKMTIPNMVFPHPQEPIAPNYTPTLTPLPDDALGSDLQQHEIENNYIVRYNEEFRETYYCTIRDWNKSYNLSAIGRDNLPIFQTINKAIPVRSQSEGATDIQSAMFNAHDFFSQARRQGYTDLKLIVFSDLADTVPPRDWVDSISLSGVFVLVAMVPFDTSTDEVSGFLQRKEQWGHWFGVYKASGFEFLTVPNSTISILVPYLEN
jgi:hypothetical protein